MSEPTERVLCPTKAAPYVQTDYPWGFQLRCERRVWIETKPKHGMRIVTQTVDPRNGRVNAPKASTYSSFVVAVETAPGFVEFRHFSMYDAHDEAGAQKFEEYVAKYAEGLSPQRVETARLVIKRHLARKTAQAAAPTEA